MKNYPDNSVQEVVLEALDELHRKDFILLENDVSERAITHKLAEYLGRRFPSLDTDCEYNRNLEDGPYKGKTLNLHDLKGKRRALLIKQAIIDADEEYLEPVSTFPDIIVHRRGVNDVNLLIVEVKKSGGAPDAIQFDQLKLAEFTNDQGSSNYRFTHGVFILLQAKVKQPRPAELTWYAKGKPLDWHL